MRFLLLLAAGEAGGTSLCHAIRFQGGMRLRAVNATGTVNAEGARTRKLYLPLIDESIARRAENLDVLVSKPSIDADLQLAAANQMDRREEKNDVGFDAGQQVAELISGLKWIGQLRGR